MAHASSKVEGGCQRLRLAVEEIVHRNTVGAAHGALVAALADGKVAGRDRDTSHDVVVKGGAGKGQAAAADRDSKLVDLGPQDVKVLDLGLACDFDTGKHRAKAVGERGLRGVGRVAERDIKHASPFHGKQPLRRKHRELVGCAEQNRGAAVVVGGEPEAAASRGGE